MQALCVAMDANHKAQCFANTASRMVETDKRLIARALAICQSAKQFSVERDCYRELDYYAGFIFKPTDPEFQVLCAGIPESEAVVCKK
jgi:histidyl-tRNA synthetase